MSQVDQEKIINQFKPLFNIPLNKENIESISTFIYDLSKCSADLTLTYGDFFNESPFAAIKFPFGKLYYLNLDLRPLSFCNVIENLSSTYTEITNGEKLPIRAQFEEKINKEIENGLICFYKYETIGQVFVDLMLIVSNAIVFNINNNPHLPGKKEVLKELPNKDIYDPSHKVGKIQLFGLLTAIIDIFILFRNFFVLWLNKPLVSTPTLEESTVEFLKKEENELTLRAIFAKNKVHYLYLRNLSNFVKRIKDVDREYIADSKACINFTSRLIEEIKPLVPPVTQSKTPTNTTSSTNPSSSLKSTTKRSKVNSKSKDSILSETTTNEGSVLDTDSTNLLTQNNVSISLTSTKTRKKNSLVINEVSDINSTLQESDNHGISESQPTTTQLSTTINCVSTNTRSKSQKRDKSTICALSPQNSVSLSSISKKNTSNSKYAETKSSDIFTKRIDEEYDEINAILKLLDITQVDKGTGKPKIIELTGNAFPFQYFQGTELEKVLSSDWYLKNSGSFLNRPENISSTNQNVFGEHNSFALSEDTIKYRMKLQSVVQSILLTLNQEEEEELFKILKGYVTHCKKDGLSLSSTFIGNDKISSQQIETVNYCGNPNNNNNFSSTGGLCNSMNPLTANYNFEVTNNMINYANSGNNNSFTNFMASSSMAMYQRSQLSQSSLVATTFANTIQPKDENILSFSPTAINNIKNRTGVISQSEDNYNENETSNATNNNNTKNIEGNEGNEDSNNSESYIPSEHDQYPQTNQQSQIVILNEGGNRDSYKICSVPVLSSSANSSETRPISGLMNYTTINANELTKLAVKQNFYDSANEMITKRELNPDSILDSFYSDSSMLSYYNFDEYESNDDNYSDYYNNNENSNYVIKKRRRVNIENTNIYNNTQTDNENEEISLNDLRKSQYNSNNQRFYISRNKGINERCINKQELRSNQHKKKKVITKEAREQKVVDLLMDEPEHTYELYQVILMYSINNERKKFITDMKNLSALYYNIN